MLFAQAASCDRRQVLLACHDLHRLANSTEAGLRVFRASWSDGRWWGDHKTTHWTPYAWRPMLAAPALPNSTMATWQEHGFGKKSREVEAHLAESRKQYMGETA